MRLAGWLRGFEVALLLLMMPQRASALDPHRAMSDYLRDRWTVGEDFPGGQVIAIAQTPDGILWIGGEKGLVRFDGVEFRSIRESSRGVPITHVLGLVTDGEGGLWIWMQGANVLRYYAGSFENATSGSRLPDLSVTAMSRTMDGGVLFSTIGQEEFQYSKGVVSRLASTSLPDALILSNAKTSDGRIWIGTRDNGLFYLEAGRVVPVLQGFAHGKVNCLLPGRRNELWIGTEEGLFFWDGSRIAMGKAPLTLRHKEILAIATDRNENLWAATARGLSRLSIEQDAAHEVTTGSLTQETTALLEDREGNLWIGSPKGLERWRDGTFVRYQTTAGALLGSGPVFADSGGRVWFGAERGGLYSVERGSVKESQAAKIGPDIVYSLAGRGSSLWVGRQRGGLTHLFPRGKGLGSRTFTQTDGLAQNSVYAVHESRDGTVWAGTLSGGLSMLKDGVWTTFTTEAGLASNTVTAIAEDEKRNIWVATPTGLSERTEGHWRSYTSRDGLPSDEITCLLRSEAAGSGDALWVGTANGLALLTAEKIWSVSPVSEVLREPVLGLAEDRSGFLWMTTPDRILRMSRQRLLEGTLAANEIREYSRSDGLPALEGVRRSRSMMRDDEGRIWISTPGGLAATATADLRRPAAPSIVQLQSILVDGQAIALDRARIPASPRRIVFQFSAVSLSAPERVRFRYRLDGFDKGWSEVSPAHEAVYTHLDPGSYRFHVAASNADGGWSDSDFSLPFAIEPALWQTGWFRGCCLSALLLMAWLASMLRMRQLARQLQLRFEERLAERMRIAQDLHDTLLQGFLSASLQLDVAADYVAADSPATPMLARVLALMRQASEDCRRVLAQLRSGERNDRNLEGALSGVPQELGLEQQASYRVVVNGFPRPLKPLCSEEIFLIGREAVLNAYRHASATVIEVELAYERAGLHVFIRDDGKGIDPSIALSGKEGHWGLTGMRERAAKIGAQFKVWSRPGKGTEIELSVPGEAAYLLVRKRKFGSKLRSWFSGKAEESLGGKEVL